MKNLFNLFFAFLFVTSFAQEDSNSFLEVKYEMTMLLDADEVVKQIPSQFRAQVESQIRQEIKDGVKLDYVLKSNGVESEYEMQEKISNAQGSAGFITQRIRQQDKGVFYKNLDRREYEKNYNVMGENFLVIDSLPEFKWNLTREKDQIAGFDVRKATGELNDSTTIEAWYAPKIKFKDGPDRAWGLPGLILKSTFDVNGTQVILTARDVAVSNEEIKVRHPEKGKKVTQKEFEEAMLEVQKKMREMYGGGVDTE